MASNLHSLLRALPEFTENPPDFIELDERYKCPQCHKVLQGALQTVCGHRVCEHHLKHINGVIYRCPVGEPDCIKVNAQNKHECVNPDFFARLEISKLLVFCTYKSEGCKATIPWKDLKNHIQNICEFARSVCPNHSRECNIKIAKKDNQHHLTSECQYRDEQCGYCGQTFIVTLMEGHVAQDCPRVPTTCPYGCASAQFPRGQLSEHEKDCTKKPVQCKYNALGCEFKGHQGMMEHHSKDLAAHLELCAVAAANGSLRTAELHSELKTIAAEYDMLKNMIGDIKKEKDDDKKNIEQLKDKMRSIQVMMAKHGEKVIQLNDKMTNNMFGGGATGPDQTLAVARAKDVLERVERRLQALESGGAFAAPEVTEGIKNQLRRQDKSVGIHDVRLAEHDLRFNITDITSYDANLIWKITDYKQRKKDAISGKTLSLYSPPFFTSRYGYKMCGRVYLNGDGIGKGTHLSLFYVLMKGEYDSLLEFPFRQKVSLMIQDQTEQRRHLQDSFRPEPTSSSFQRPARDMNVASGCPLFVRQDTLETSGYMKDDCIFIKLVVDVNDPPIMPI